MTVSEPGPRFDTKKLIARVQNILTRPQAEWEVIETEKATPQELFRDYVAPLAAIPAVASFLRMLVGGLYGPIDAFTKAAVSYAFSLLGVWLIGLVIYELADNFAARQDRLKAMKTAVYSSTPIWLAGVVFLVPQFDFFFVFSLYSIYVLYRGLAVMMKAPADKVVGYESAVVGVAIAVFVILIAITAVVGGSPRAFTR
jgi:hypothetical protein